MKKSCNNCTGSPTTARCPKSVARDCGPAVKALKSDLVPSADGPPS